MRSGHAVVPSTAGAERRAAHGLGFAVIIGAIVVTQGLVGRLHEVLGLGPLRVGSIQHALPLVLAVHFTYAGYVRVMERRSVAELSGGGALRESGVGALVGFTLLAGSVAAIAALGSYHVDAVNPWTTLIPPLVSIVVLVRAHRAGHVMRPFWRRAPAA